MSKTILITGATDGIGKITATELAQMGHTVIVHGRNLQKAQRIVNEIQQTTHNSHVDYLIADLFSMQAISEMVEAFNQKYDHLDVLINNAGAVLDAKRFETADGVEGTIALNVMAPLLLSELLLPALQRSVDGRIINMSSATYRRAKPDMTDLNLSSVASGQTRYGISKLFVIWNTQEMAAKLRQKGITNVTVNVSHPGAVATNFGQDSDNGFINNLIYKVALGVSRFIPALGAPESGAVTNVYLASSDDVKGVSGQFFDNKKHQITPKNTSTTPENKQQLWHYSMEKLKPWLDETQAII